MSSKERFMFRVGAGVLEPADEYTRQRLRDKGYHKGDILAATLAKPRNPQFHRYVHQFGALVVDNIEDFEGLTAHAVLKRLQLEGDIGCEEIPLKMPGVGPVSYRVPKSLAYDSMDDGQFSEVFTAMCRYVQKRYWPELTPEEIADMAQMMPQVA